MDADIPEGRGVEAAVEALRATNFRLRCLELRRYGLQPWRISPVSSVNFKRESTLLLCA